MALRPQIWREKNRLDLLGGVFNQRCPATDLSLGTSLNYKYRIYGCQAWILLLISRLESEMRLAGAEISQRIFKRRQSPQFGNAGGRRRSEEHTSELQSHSDLVCRLLLEKKNEESLTRSITAISLQRY